MRNLQTCGSTRTLNATLGLPSKPGDPHVKQIGRGDYLGFASADVSGVLPITTTASLTRALAWGFFSMSVFMLSMRSTLLGVRFEEAGRLTVAQTEQLGVCPNGTNGVVTRVDHPLQAFSVGFALLVS